MSCDYPRKMYGANSAKGPQFNRPDGKYIPIPCRMCLGCRLDYGMNWGIRGMVEAREHEESQFITLTYDQENLPEDWSLNPDHTQKFIRALRKKVAPKEIKFMLSGEYGGVTSRPHYHGILFGLELPDRQPFSTNERGEMLYTSKTLEDVWGKGFVLVGDVTEQSCRYSVSYMLKDTQGDYDKSNPYLVVDPTTHQTQERLRPFSRFSNRPGIGRKGIEKYLKEIFPNNFMVMRKLSKPFWDHSRGGNTQSEEYVIRPVPTYALKIAREIDKKLYEEVAAAREEFIKSDAGWKRQTAQARKAITINRDARLGLATRGGQKTKTINRIAVIDQRSTRVENLRKAQDERTRYAS